MLGYQNTNTGPDGIPSEVFKFCPSVKSEIFHFISYIWDGEVVPPNLTMVNFRMFFKNKGSRDDPSRYRCIALLNHAYKALSLIILGRLIGISDSSLQDWQAGFREARGCRDNTMILRVLCDKILSLGKSLTVVQYLTRFHINKFFDTALKEVVASTKVR